MDEMQKKIDFYVANNPWKFSLWLMPIGIPLALWGSWETINTAPHTTIKILLALGIAIVTYVGAGLLFWFHGWAQRKWRKHGVIGDSDSSH